MIPKDYVFRTNFVVSDNVMNKIKAFELDLMKKRTQNETCRAISDDGNSIYKKIGFPNGIDTDVDESKLRGMCVFTHTHRAKDGTNLSFKDIYRLFYYDLVELRAIDNIFVYRAIRTKESLFPSSEDDFIKNYNRILKETVREYRMKYPCLTDEEIEKYHLCDFFNDVVEKVLKYYRCKYIREVRK